MLESSQTAGIVLEHLLGILDVGVAQLTARDVRAGCGVQFGAAETPILQYCMAGRGTLAIAGTRPIPLEPHTFVLLPPRVAYRLEGASPRVVGLVHSAQLCSVPAQSLDPMPAVAEARLGMLMVYGELHVGLAGGSDLLTPSSEPIVVRFDGEHGLREQFAMLLAESARPGAGSRVLTEALLKQCLVLALRRWIESDASSSLPLLAGAADARLGRALQAVLERPASAFTVDHLAMIAGMSRSAFAAAFRRAFGQSPMSLVRLVRLRRARALLVATRLPVAAVARRVGFSSRSNFSLAFTQLHGMDPSSFRRSYSVSPDEF
jgi:AraC-like DNA-binding protein